MSKLKREQCIVSTTAKKSSQQKPFVQIEAELIEDQLDAIANGLMKLTTLYLSCKEEIIFSPKREKFTAIVTPKKFRQNKPLVHTKRKLTQEQLEAISGGGIETSPEP